MTDTDKYEGHTPAPWRYYDDEEHDCWVFEGEDIEAQARVAFFAFTPCEGIAYLDDPDLNLMIDAPLLLEEVKRLREALVGDSEDWNTDELVEKALTLHDKALAFDAIYDWHTRMQLQGEGIAHDLDRMDWLLKNPTKGYEDYDKEMIE